ncbi:energy transducer TonB [Candidatus Dependentiae bacterium]
MKKERANNLKKRHIFLISLMLHLIVLILLFFFFRYSVKDIFFKKQKKQAKVIFKKPKPKPKPLPKPKPKVQPPKPKPKPRPKLPAFQGLKKPRAQQKPKPKPIPKIQEKKPDIKPKPKPKPKKKPLVKKSPQKTRLIKKQIPEKKALPKKPEPKKPVKQEKPVKPVKPEQKPQKLTLKDISKGFLDYAQKQGANLIQYTKSAKGMPTEEQLKHERYIKKIFDCIETSLKIRKNTLMVMRPVSPRDTLIVLINIVLNNNGRVNHTSVAKTSGIHAFDQFMLSIINESSTSFPPVPSYLSKNTYSLPIKFFIPAGMVMARRSAY